MGNFTDIQLKLQEFVKKYYVNELLKGLILFTAFGLLYFLITLFIEHLLWLQPNIRTILFFAFVLVELALLLKFILIPITKLIGLKKGISLIEASKIIGRHFKEVDDKLLNVLQLNQTHKHSELLVASIEQKSASLRPIPFKRAISFKSNIKYLKYLSIPLLIWAFTALSGNRAIFNDSLNRVVNYQTAYEPPAPFAFKVLNEELKSVEGNTFELEVETVGDIIPDNVQIVFDEQNYLLKDQELGRFSYAFENLKETISFYLAANGVRSRPYLLDVVKTPVIIGFDMFLNYPAYTGKRDELVKNTGNAIIPEGTRITWNILTKETDSVIFLSNVKEAFNSDSDNKFSLTKRVNRNLNYQISTSNLNLKAYEKLNYAVQVIKDEAPGIRVKSDIDSINRGPAQFAGQLSDDYGLSRLQLVYYKEGDQDSANIKAIPISKTVFDEFYYVFDPEGELKLEKGEGYEMYFEVFDNDAVNGAKSTKSKTFSYYFQTEQEVTDQLLKEQKQSLDELNKTAKSTEKLSRDFEDFSKKLKNKADLNWNDKKELDQFIERQEQYQEMLQQHTDNLKENLDEQEQNTDDKSIKEKKEKLKKRIEEAQKLQQKDELLKQLKEMSEKLDKEKMLENLDKLTEETKQSKRSLERLLEMTKRFYVEKKMVQIGKKLDSLSQKQNKEADSENSLKQEQEKLNEEFQEIRKDLQDLQDQNRKLAQPMRLPETKFDEDVIEETMKQAQENLESQDAADDKENQSPEKQKTQKKAKNLQKAASAKMKQLSEKMQGAVQAMQGEMINANIETLRAILENLLTFSFDQEQLMLSFEDVDASKPDFPVKLKKQQILKENFEHIDDSLYTLSLRVQQLSSNIQKHLSETHYNLDKSLENIAENRIQRGMSNQQFTMTSANNLADMLSDLLNSLQNPSSGGEGKGNQNSFSLPTIIQKQGELKGKMQEGMKKGEEGKPGKGEGGTEGMTGEQYEIYKEQNALKEALKQLLEKEGGSGTKGQKALEQMEELEKQLLDKGFKNEVLQRMQQMEHELLKLEKAHKQQGKDNTRKSETNTTEFANRKLPKIKGDKLFFSADEILDRKPLPLRSTYKKKVQQYFKAKEK